MDSFLPTQPPALCSKDKVRGFSRMVLRLASSPLPRDKACSFVLRLFHVLALKPGAAFSTTQGWRRAEIAGNYVVAGLGVALAVLGGGLSIKKSFF